MAPAALDAKAAELRLKLRSVPDELEAWYRQSEAGGPFEKHHTQIRRLGYQIEGLYTVVLTDFDEHVRQKTLLRFAASLEMRALAIHTVWDFFRTKLALRAVEPFARPLKTADAFARECYEPARRHLAGPHGGVEPPLVTLDNHVSPWAKSRDMPYQPALDPGALVKTAAFSEVVSKLPIPLLGLPWHYMTYLPHLSFLAHECGHAVERDFGLGTRLDDGLKARFTGDHLDAWLAWRAEAFADVYACLCAGPSFARSLTAVLDTDVDVVTRETRPAVAGGWGSYPTRTLRVLLNAMALETFSFAEAAEEIRRDWRTAYPCHRMTGYEDDLPTVVDAFRTAATLPEPDLAFKAADQARAVQTAKIYAAGGRYQKTDVVPVRTLVAAGAELLRTETSPRLEELWAALAAHAVESRPPGIWAGDAARAGALDREAERRRGAALAATLFDGLDEDAAG